MSIVTEYPCCDKDSRIRHYECKEYKECNWNKSHGGMVLDLGCNSAAKGRT